MIGLPPVLAGAVQARLAWPLPAVACTEVGAEGPEIVGCRPTAVSPVRPEAAVTWPVPSAGISTIRAFPESATKTLPVLSTVTPLGWLKPLPRLTLVALDGAPPGRSSVTVLAPFWETTTLPSEAMAMPQGWSRPVATTLDDPPPAGTSTTRPFPVSAT